MAILFSPGSAEQARLAEPLRRALSHAIALAEGGAGVLALDALIVVREPR